MDLLIGLLITFIIVFVCIGLYHVAIVIDAAKTKSAENRYNNALAECHCYTGNIHYADCKFVSGGRY